MLAAISFERRAKVGTAPGHRIRTREMGFAHVCCSLELLRGESRALSPSEAARFETNHLWEGEDN